MMQYLSQRNPNWASVKMAPSQLTLGRYGCTSTCISMLSDYFGCFKSPSEMIWSKVIKYTIDGLILWNSLFMPCFKFEKRLYGFHKAEIDKSLADPNKAVILEVANRSHWVVALRKNFWGNDYWICDPWDGKKKLCLKTYRNITGSAHFNGNHKPAVPPYSF